MKLIVDTSNTYFLESINKDIDTLLDMHNNILSKKIIGKSVEGRNIISLKIGINKNNIKKKPSILFTGGIHAREDFSVMLVMKMLDYIAYHYNTNKRWEGVDINNLLNKIDMHFIPVVNPDGLNIVHNGVKASCNSEKIQSMPIINGKEEYWKANANGVDINKNFDDGNWHIRKSKPEMSKPCSEGYKGFKPSSEPETRALTEFCKQEEFLMTVSYHCSGNVVFWADSGTHDIFNNYDEELIDEFSNKFIYRKTKISQDPSWYGCGFENWYRSYYQRPGLCIELSPFKSPEQHPDYMFDELVWEYAKLTGIYLADKAYKLADKMYDVILNDKLIKTFYKKDEAVKFAQNLKDSYVTNNERTIWTKVENFAALHKE